MTTIIGLLLLAAFVFWLISFKEGIAYIDRAAFGCLLLAVALLAFGGRLH